MYRNLRQCVDDLQATGQLVRIEEPVEAELEVAEIQRRVFRAGGPAVLFEQVAGCRFPMLGNLFGTIDRVRYLFRHSLGGWNNSWRSRVDPADVMRRPRLYLADAVDGPAGPAAEGAHRAGAGPRDVDRPTAAVEVVAGRRRGLHHAAAGLYRGPRPAGPGPWQPGHVSRAAFGRAVRARTARWGCTIRFIAASPPIMPRRCGEASSCG